MVGHVPTLLAYCGSKYKSTQFFEFHFSVSSPLSAGSASSALPSGSSSGSSGSLVSELHRRFSSMQGTTHRSYTPTLRTLSGTEAALIPHKGCRRLTVHRMTFPLKTSFLWVCSVKQHQQLARKRSFLPSPPPPPSFNRSIYRPVILCSRATQKRLLRRLSAPMKK